MEWNQFVSDVVHIILWWQVLFSFSSSIVGTHIRYILYVVCSNVDYRSGWAGARALPTDSDETFGSGGGHKCLHKVNIFLISERVAD